jgi:hypothetical protein
VTERRRNSVLTSLRMQEWLIAQGSTAEVLEKVSGLGSDGVMRWLRQMRKEGRVHIESYTHDRLGRVFTPVYRWGSMADAPRPGARETPAERQRRIRGAVK